VKCREISAPGGIASAGEIYRQRKSDIYIGTYFQYHCDSAKRLKGAKQDTAAQGGLRGPLETKLPSRAKRGARGRSDVFLADEAPV